MGLLTFGVTLEACVVARDVNRDWGRVWVSFGVTNGGGALVRFDSQLRRRIGPSALCPQEVLMLEQETRALSVSLVL